MFILRTAAMFSRLLRIDRCELVLVDVTPVGQASSITPHRPKSQVTWFGVSLLCIAFILTLFYVVKDTHLLL